jgi:hypothetical protein
LETEAAALKRRLDFPARVRDSLAAHPSSWLAGSLVSGLAASLLFRRKPAIAKKSHGLVRSLLGLTATAAQPLLKVWLANQLKSWLSAASQAASPTPGPFPSHPTSKPR